MNQMNQPGKSKLDYYTKTEKMVIILIIKEFRITNFYIWIINNKINKRFRKKRGNQ